MRNTKKDKKANYLSLFLIALVALTTISGNANSQQLSPAERSVSPLGAENTTLKSMEGTFEVKETIWNSPTAAPTYNTKLIAKRKMIGSILQEFIYAAPGKENSPLERIEYFSYNRIEGRWTLISMDIRVPVGLMPAASFDRGQKGKVTVMFQPFAIAGKGSTVGGQMLRMDETINYENSEHVIKEQHFILADGSGKSWLAHRYEYTRHR